MYKNIIEIKDNDLINYFLLDILELYKKYYLKDDILYIVGSVADRIVSESFETNIIYRDKFKDIDCLYFGCNKNLIEQLKLNKKIDYINSFLNNEIYKIDSSIAEVIFDIDNKKASFSDGYFKTITTGYLYPPIWHKRKFDKIFQGTLDCPDKAFQRCKSRDLKLSKEMVSYMNKLMDYVWSIDQNWIEALAIFNSNKYKIDYNLDWSQKWKTFFFIYNQKYSDDNIKEAKKYIDINKNRLYFK